MKRVLFITNYASPYKVEFYDELSRHLDVTVLFSDTMEEQTHRTKEWFTQGKGGFQSVQLNRRAGTLLGENFCLDVVDWLKKPFDEFVVCGYSSPTAMLAIFWLKLMRKPFYIQADGGLIRETSGPRYWLKRLLVSQASGWISSGRQTTIYLMHYGAKEKGMHLYPFTSLWEKDISAAIADEAERKQLRRELNMPEEKILLYVGRYDPKKGMEDLLYSTPEIDADAGIYFIGGEPTETHKAFCEEKDLKNVHFVGFRKKEELARYYRAADLLVLPTWSDVWGLVINEAMAQGLPVVTTDQCVAGLELVEDGINGYIVPARDCTALTEAVNRVLAADYRKMGASSLEKIRPYTIENMVKAYVDVLS